MKTLWPRLKVGQILQLQRRWIKLNPMQEYTEIGIRSYGRGIFQKPPVVGASLGNKRVLKVCPGDLVFMNVFAWEGAVAVASPKEQGTIGSHRFATYTPVDGSCDPRFLQLYFQTKAGRELLGRVSPGSAGRNRTMNLEMFSAQEVLCPPLDEQRRIVARIEGFLQQIADAKQLRNDADSCRNVILASAMNEIWGNRQGWNASRIDAVASTVSGQVNPTIQPYSSLPHINGESMESGTCRLLNNYRTAGEDGVTSGKYHFKPDAVLYSKIRPYLRKAVQVDFEGVCSADVYAFDTISPQLDRRFFAYSLIAPPFTAYANNLSGRTRMPKLNQNQMFAFELEYPPLPEQRRFVAYLDSLSTKILTLKTLQSNVELEALVPSILDRAFKGEL